MAKRVLGQTVYICGEVYTIQPGRGNDTLPSRDSSDAAREEADMRSVATHFWKNGNGGVDHTLVQSH